MARKPRFYIKDVPCHVVQRGNNRQDCFFCHDDYGFYINSLQDALQHYDVQLHAYVLMTNHVHLLMTPQDSAGISRVMQSVGRAYVGYVNKQYKRSGTLWEGRHKASLIETERYLMLCQRYIELNPVRAKMVAHPEQYHWSSYQFHGAGKPIACLTPHTVYQMLGDNAESRRIAYQALFSSELQKAELDTLRQCAAHNYPVGGEQFRAEIEQVRGVRLGQCGPGRPGVDR
tara:strand:+ start:1477 stop:2166 length:690 start_codon:yes stop_codon:yes gene_type:complete